MLLFSVFSDVLLSVKTPALQELKTIVEYLSDEIAEAQVQEVLSTEEGLVLTLYRFHLEPKLVYLVLDLDKVFPFIGLFTQQPWKALKKPKPVGLFLSAHLKNLKINSIKLLEPFGRVVEIWAGTHLRLEFRVIPKQGNLLIELTDNERILKKISWDKVTELTHMQMATKEPESTEFVNIEESQRSIPFMMNQWFERRANFKTQSTKKTGLISESPYEKWVKQRIKDRTKKQKAIDLIKLQINEYKDIDWMAIGNYLKVYGFKNFPIEWTKFVDFENSVSKNIQRCFEKKKQYESKMQGTQLRLLTLQKEIENLNNTSENQFLKQLGSKNSEKNNKLTRKSEGRFRRLNLSQEGLECLMGKSAKDNLDLLRKAKSWDFWLHLKDFPSAHAILHRNKDQNIPQEELIKCGQWLIKEGLGDKFLKQGGKLSVVVAECRHVKPIKGDKLGRVTYHNAREILIAY